MFKIKSKLLFILIFFSLESFAFAGTISMQSSSTITISKESNYFRIHGTYVIENKGTEAAFDVFPKLSFGDWLWQGKGEQLASNSKRSWQIESKILFEQLKCKGECSKLKLPLKGVFPIKAITFYKDGAGYPFSTADIINLPFELEGGMKAEIAKSPGLVLALEQEAKAQEFKVKVHGRTLRQGIKEVNLSFISSKEIDILQPKQIIAVDKKGNFEAEVLAKNKSGTVGSSYRFIAVAEWKEKSLGGLYRVTVNDSINLKINQESKLFSFVVMIVAFLIFGFSAIYYYVYAE